jgi:integrase
VKVISERLGHSRSSFTADAYQHAVEELEHQAADDIAARVFGGAR